MIVGIDFSAERLQKAAQQIGNGEREEKCKT